MVANVVTVVRRSERFAAQPAGPAIFFYLSEISEVSDAATGAIVFAAEVRLSLSIRLFRSVLECRNRS